jgi:hypothetical protein
LYAGRAPHNITYMADLAHADAAACRRRSKGQSVAVMLLAPLLGELADDTFSLLI